MVQDKTLGLISSMRGFLGQIFQQTIECAYLIKDHAETKSFGKSCCCAFHILSLLLL